MKRLLALLVMFFLAASPLNANESFLIGQGVVTCGQFAAHYRNDPDVVEGAFFDWAQGFMSGLNAAFDLRGVGKSIDLKSISMSNSEQSAITALTIR